MVGEESVAADPALLSTARRTPISRSSVDPVDGTANFAAGLPLFAVMASVVVEGETVAGIIYDPMGDDWVLAEQGGGAWHAAGPMAPAPSGQLSHVTPCRSTRWSACARSPFLPPEPQRRAILRQPRTRSGVAANYRVRRPRVPDLRRRPRCISLMFNKLMPWDHLPGTLICQGGRRLRARFDGSPYRPQPPGGRPDRWRPIARSWRPAAARGLYGLRSAALHRLSPYSVSDSGRRGVRPGQITGPSPRPISRSRTRSPTGSCGLLDDYCDIRDGLKVLDVGCGKAWVMRQWAERFAIDGVGLEPNRCLPRRARSQAADARRHHASSRDRPKNFTRPSRELRRRDLPRRDVRAGRLCAGGGVDGGARPSRAAPWWSAT